MTKAHAPQDHIYGPLDIPPYCWQFIDTPEFQRLRFIKQLGSCYIVYPGATHTRFEHAIGCCHLANAFMATIKKNQPSLNVTDEQVQAVVLAALCHDLGQGPFSHTFDVVAHHIDGFEQWQPIEMSETLFLYLIRKYHIELAPVVVSAVRYYILGHHYKPWPLWLSQVVRNSKTNIDVNTFDYLARDSKRTLCTSMFTFWRLISNCRVFKPEGGNDEELCWKLSEVPTIEAFLYTKNEMYMTVYYHKVSQALSLMIQDIFLKADPSMICLEDYLCKPELFVTLDDRIIMCAERGELGDVSREIAEAIKQRKLYKFIYESVLDTTKKSAKTLSQQNPNELQSSFGAPDDESMEDLRIVSMRYTYGQSETENPLLQTYFWSVDHDGKQSVFKLKPQDITNIRPVRLSDTRLRMFCTREQSAKRLKEVCAEALSQKLADDADV